jgi:hypothetical protein
MAKGIQNMSAEIVKGKKGEEPSEPVIKQKSKEKKPKLHNRVGKGSFSPTVIMKKVDGTFVKVKRNDVLKQIDAGWVPVNKRLYREALAGGASAAMVEVKLK